MITLGHAGTTFLGYTWAFAHHQSIVLFICGGVKSEVRERRRELDDCAAGKREHGRHSHAVHLSVMRQ